MKRLIAVLVLLLGTIVVWAGDEPKSSFLRANPDYRTRAGTFYEREYLPGAVKGLVAAFAPQVLPEATATKILRDFIYEFLDQLAEDGGQISRRGHAEVLAGLDARVRELADGPGILDNYEAWKRGSKKEFPNPLAFLTVLAFQSPPVPLDLSPELTEMGWSLKSLQSLAETAEYADVMEVEPYQVFVLEQEGDTAEGGRTLTLLLYLSKDLPRVLTALDARAKVQPDDDTKAVAPQLFWRTSRCVVLLLEANPMGDGDQLKQGIRRQWISL